METKAKISDVIIRIYDEENLARKKNKQSWRKKNMAE